jgi:hypothetical protein
MNLKFLNSLPLHYYRMMAVPSIAISGLLTWLTIRYFTHGAEALETDPVLKALAVITVIALVSAELMSGWMAAMLSGQRFRAWCAALYTYSGFIFLMEFLFICIVQISGALSVDMAQAKLGAEAASLQARIDRIESSVNTKRQTANLQVSKARDAYELKLAAKSSREATDEELQTKPLYEDLRVVKAKMQPTLTTTMDFIGNIVGFNFGLAFSIGLIVARCFGLSAGALMFSMFGGALWRRGSAVEAQQAFVNAAAAPVSSTEPMAFGKPAPAPVPFGKVPSPAPVAVPAMPSWTARIAASIKKALPTWQQAAVVPAAVGAASGVSAKAPEAPEPAQPRVEYSIKLEAQKAPKLAANDDTAAPAEPAAPAAPAPAPELAPEPAPAPELTLSPALPKTAPAAADHGLEMARAIMFNPAQAEEHEKPAAKPSFELKLVPKERAETPAPAAPAPEQALEIVSNPAQNDVPAEPVAPAAAPEHETIVQAPAAEPEHAAEIVLNKARKTTTGRKLGPQVDTGTGEHDGYRFRRLKEAVMGGLKPTVANLIIADVPCSTEVARGYQRGMVRDGVLVRKGNRYMLAPKYAAQLNKDKAKAKTTAKSKSKPKSEQLSLLGDQA